MFRRYIYASSYPATKFKFSPDDISYCESALLPLLSTQNTQIILSNPMWTRVEKTNYIANNTLVKKWLNVCWANQLSNMIDNSSLKDGKIKPNCGKCGKCLRTLFTLELLGVNLKEYETLFDLDEYNKNKNRFIIKCLATKKKDAFSYEIVRLMKEKKYSIPFKLKLLAFAAKIGVYKFVQKVFGYRGMPH